MTASAPRCAGSRPPRAAVTLDSRLRVAGLTVALVSLAPAAATATDQGAATVILVARSIGSRRGEPLDARAHAAVLVRIGGRPGGFVVQGGKEPVPGTIFGPRHRVVGWAIPARDPADEFARAVGGYWGEPGVREVPIREIARFTVKGLTEARVRELVDSLNQEFRGRDYHLEGGPSSNSFVSRLLDRLGLPLPPLGEVQMPGWGWRP